MRLPGILYLLGMALLFLGERLVGGEDLSRYTLDMLGLLGVLAALGLMARDMGSAPANQKAAWKTGLVYGGVGLASLGVYALQSDMVLDALAFAEDDTERKYEVAISVAWSILWLAGTLPFLAVDRGLSVAPKAAVPRRVAERAAGGLSFALAFAFLFPLNYLASETNERWDLGYFKTAQPGTSTLALADGVEEPVVIYAFFPSSSDVTAEIRTYLDLLDRGQVRVEYVDHALEPELAKELKVRDNGYLVFVRGEGEDQQIERLKVGTDFDSAKRTLKKLDQEVRENLLKVGRGKKTAYVTVGHGELFWKGGELPDDKINNLKKVLRALNYKVKELGLAEGLQTDVPEDADMVMILGPTTAFEESELKSLAAYVERGGALLVGLEPGGPDMSAVIGPLGVTADTTRTLAHETKFVPRTYKPVDRVNLITNKYSTHESVTTLSRNSQMLVTIFAGAVVLDTTKDDTLPGAKTTVTVRSLTETFADVDGDLNFDRTDGEETKTFSLAVASEGPAPKGTPTLDADGNEIAPQFRALVVADATWISDAALILDPQKGNFQLLMDTMAWLGREDALAGTVNSENDVKIEHTKEGQGVWFYGTTFAVPLMFLGLGLGRIRLRRRQGGAK